MFFLSLAKVCTYNCSWISGLDHLANSHNTGSNHVLCSGAKTTHCLCTAIWYKVRWKWLLFQTEHRNKTSNTNSSFCCFPNWGKLFSSHRLSVKLLTTHKPPLGCCTDWTKLCMLESTHFSLLSLKRLNSFPHHLGLSGSTRPPLLWVSICRCSGYWAFQLFLPWSTEYAFKIWDKVTN